MKTTFAVVMGLLVAASASALPLERPAGSESEEASRARVDAGVTLYSEGREAEALDQFSMACAAGDARGCARLGNSYFFGAGTATDHARSFSYNLRGCRGGAPSGCGNLAYHYEKGHGGPVRRARALALYDAACDEGHRWSCKQLERLGYRRGATVSSR